MMLKGLVAILAAALLAGAAAVVFLLVGRGHERQPVGTVAAHRHHPAAHKRPSGFSWPQLMHFIGEVDRE